MSEVKEGLSRFSVEIGCIELDNVYYDISPSYGGDAEIGVPFWSPSRPRVIAMLSGDRFDPGPEWKQYRIPLLELFLASSDGYQESMIKGARLEISRVLAEKGE